MTVLDAKAIKFWDAANARWVSPTRGRKGPPGPTGPTGPAGSQLVKMMAHRRLSPGIALTDNWYDFIFDTVPQAQEINPCVSSFGTTGFRVAKPGAYLVCTNTTYATAMPVGHLWGTSLFRTAFDSAIVEMGRTGAGAGGGANGLTQVILASPADVLALRHYKTASAALTHTSTVNIAYLGPCKVRDYDWAVVLDHVDVTYGLSRTNTYTVTPNVGSTLTGDWVYLIHLHWWETAGIEPAIPSGFEVVVPLQTTRTPGSNGIQWGIWRKKYAAGESYTVNLSDQRFTHATLVSVRQPTDAKPILSPLVAPRAGVASSAITVPGGELGTTGLSVAVTDTGNLNLTPPPSVSAPGLYGWSVPPGPSRTTLAVATLGPNLAATTPITFTWSGTVPDVGWIGGVTLSWQSVPL